MPVDFLRAEAELVLTEARREKAERTKSLGSPIQLSGVALAMHIRDGEAWVAENTTLTKRIDLETGATLQTYRGHTGPVSALAFCDKVHGSGDGKILITGSWDQSIKLWNTDTMKVVSSTPAHSDFVKGLLVFGSLQLLVSSGSDTIIRFWDISTANEGGPLTLVASISSHRRPVECLDGMALSDTSLILYTADTMGVINVWELLKESHIPTQWKPILKRELNHHRTRINEMLYGNGHLWTASSDDTVQVLSQEVNPHPSAPLPPITHPTAVRAILPLALTDLAEPYLLTGSGDVIRVYDVSSPEEPELVREVDAHWHDVTALRLWMRKSVGVDGRTRIEPWMVSTSLDGTIRKWRLSELLSSAASVTPSVEQKPLASEPAKADKQFEMTAEEEQELAELLDSD